MSHKQIYYSDKYDDEKYEYRCVRLVIILLLFDFTCLLTLFYNLLRQMTFFTNPSAVYNSPRHGHFDLTSHYLLYFSTGM